MLKSQTMIAAIFMMCNQAAFINARSVTASSSTSMSASPGDQKYNKPNHHQPLLSTDKSIISSPYRHLEGDEDHDGDHDDDVKKKPWGLMFAFTLLVNLATLCGVVFLIPMLSGKARTWVRSGFGKNKLATESIDPAKKKSNGALLDIVIPSFAAGALIAMAVFLVIPEGLYLIQTFLNEKGGDDHGDEHLRFLEGEDGDHDEHEGEDKHEGELTPEAIWRFGASLLGGFMIPMLFDFILPRNKEMHFDGDECGEEKFQDDVEEAAGTKTIDLAVTVVKPATPIKYGLVLSVIFGDSLCNFSDGVFIGAAVSLCDLKTTYVIVGVTLYHEIGQELADYLLLTKHAGLTPLVALLLNFASGLTVCLGGIVVLAASVSDMSVGVILTVAAGTYVYLAACECLPRVNDAVKTSKDRALSMLMFIIGVIPIALTLLNHTHCEAEGHDDH